MGETPAEQRTRILKTCVGNAEPWEYDLAVALGYAPESWDGMWKLTEHPFSVRHGIIVARHVLGAIQADYTMKTRLVAHRIPEGWGIICDSRLTEIEPRDTIANRGTMAETPRQVKVNLTVDTTEFISAVTQMQQMTGELIDTLTNAGFSKGEAERTVKRLFKDYPVSVVTTLVKVISDQSQG